MSEIEIGELGDCDCNAGADATEGAGTGAAPMRFKRRRPPKVKKPRSKGTGTHCVMSHKGKVVHCYEQKATADRVAEAFTRRGRAGTKFTVKKR